VLRFDSATNSAEIGANLTYDGTTLAVAGEVSGSSSIHTKNFHELYSNLGSGGSVTIDLTTANNFQRTVTTATTFTFDNPPTGPRAFGFTLVLINGGSSAITWPVSIAWAGGVAPALSASGTDILVFYTYDGGSTYYGFLSAANMS
jgi:hypothetical protein